MGFSDRIKGERGGHLGVHIHHSVPTATQPSPLSRRRACPPCWAAPRPGSQNKFFPELLLPGVTALRKVPVQDSPVFAQKVLHVKPLDQPQVSVGRG